MANPGNARRPHPWLETALAWMLALALASQAPLSALAADDSASNDNSASNDDSKPDVRSPIETLFPNFEILTLVSPGLLESSSTEANDALSESEANKESDFAGTYSAALEPRDGYDQLYSVARGTLMPDRCAALVRSGATLLFVDGRLMKLGDASDASQAARYGTNSVLTVLGSNANALLVNSFLESDAVGAPGIIAVDSGLALAQNASIETASQQSSALATAFDGTILANALEAQTCGSQSAALFVTTKLGSISAANSSFSTAGQESPLVSSAGRIELDNVSGMADNSPVAMLRDAGSLIVQGSRLVSNQQQQAPTEPTTGAIALYREDAVSLETLHENTVFQADGSSIKSDLKTGSLFYVTNTRAKILLSNTSLEFDDASMPLLMAMGNNANGWGTQGSNGASVTFTAANQTLQGDVIVDAQSSVDLFLLDSSNWRGSARNVASTSNSLTSDQLNVSIDGGSTWVVSSNSSVTNLSLAPGARLIDPQGKGVKIHDGNGFSLVDGASDITVTVTGSFSSTIKTTSDNVLEGSQIDRSTFDNTFGLQTTFGTNDSSAYTPDELRISRLSRALQDWFKSI